MNRKNNKEDGAGRNRQPSKLWSILIGLAGAYAAQQYAAHEKADTDKSIAFWSMITGLGTWAAATFAAGAAVIFFCQLQTMLDNDAPFVSVTGISFVGGRQPGFSSLVVDWQNAGRTSAVDMRTQINFLSTSIRWQDWLVNCDYRTAHPRVALGGQTSAHLSVLNLPLAALNDFQKFPNQSIHVWGTTTYSDNGRKAHKSRFCWNVENIAEKDGVLVPTHSLCRAGNCTDGECRDDDARYPPLGTCQLEIKGTNIIVHEPRPAK